MRVRTGDNNPAPYLSSWLPLAAAVVSPDLVCRHQVRITQDSNQQPAAGVAVLLFAEPPSPCYCGVKWVVV